MARSKDTKDKKENQRAKKRNVVRQRLYEIMNDRELHRLCEDHIRALRYLRLRNQEMAMLNVIVRLERCIRVYEERQRQQQGRQQQEGRRKEPKKLVPCRQPRD